VKRETLERNEGMKFGLAMTMKQAKANQTEAQEGPHLHGGRLPAFLPTPPAELPSGSRGWRALAEKILAATSGQTVGRTQKCKHNASTLWNIMSPRRVGCR
jgi:hypothetical protein